MAGWERWRSLFRMLLEGVRAMPVVLVVEAGVIAIFTGLAALAKKLWDFSPWWSALIVAGVLTASLGLFAWWHAKPVWQDDRRRRLEVEARIRKLLELRDAADHLLSVIPGSRRTNNDGWINSLDKTLRSAEAWTRLGNLPEDVAALIHTPKEHVDLEPYSEPIERIGPAISALATLHLGLTEAADLYRSKESLRP